MIDTTEFWRWVLASPAELRAEGLDPAERIKHCGHPARLAPHWALTAGMWALRKPAEIMKTAGVTVAAYDVFKFRHRLMSRDGFIRRHALNPAIFKAAGRVQLASLAHIRVHNLVKDPAMHLGGAAAVAALRETPRGAMNTLGVLPAEALLYYHGVEAARRLHGMSVEDWHAAETSEDWLVRQRMWVAAGADDLVVLPPGVETQYA